jgi:hypothetical protein
MNTAHFRSPRPSDVLLMAPIAAPQVDMDPSESVEVVSSATYCCMPWTMGPLEESPPHEEDEEETDTSDWRPFTK